jgi:hypothetical protein
MSRDGISRRTHRLRLAATFLLPLAVLVASELTGRIASVPIDDALERAQATLESRFAELLTEARRVTETAFPADDARDLPLRAGRLWGGRLEGLAIYDARGEAESWQGTPAEPPPGFLDPQSPRFTVRADGVRTRLLVRGDVDGTGRQLLGSFIVDSALDDGLAWRALLGAAGGLRVELAFVDGETEANDRAATFAEATRAGAESSACVVRLAGGGTTLAVAALHTPTGEDRVTVRWREGGRAWAALLFALLLGTVLTRRADRSAGAVLVRWAGWGWRGSPSRPRTCPPCCCRARSGHRASTARRPPGDCSPPRQISSSPR